jgi:hypothetical protein
MTDRWALSNQQLSSDSNQSRLAGAVIAAKATVPKTAAPDATEHDQLARDLAEIERATAVLRRAQPGLESWTVAPAPPPMPTPRPVWLLIGLLWLSTALVTAGAVVAIAALVG